MNLVHTSYKTTLYSNRVDFKSYGASEVKPEQADIGTAVQTDPEEGKTVLQSFPSPICTLL